MMYQMEYEPGRISAHGELYSPRRVIRMNSGMMPPATYMGISRNIVTNFFPNSPRTVSG